jgi:YwiC-like protein
MSVAPGSTVAPVAAQAPSHPALRPLVLPTEHGGWGFLLEPLILGMLVAPSRGGALIALAALFAFLTRQPLKLAMQDALRRKSYARTFWCRSFAIAYAALAAISIAAAIAISGWILVMPFALVVPLALVVLFADAKNRSRALLPEISGSIAMASTAASIALASGSTFLAAFSLMALIALRGIPSILYVRTLLTRAHKQTASPAPALIAHGIAIPIAYAVGSTFAVAATLALLARAAWGLTHDVPPAKTIGWREIGWGAVAVALFAR